MKLGLSFSRFNALFPDEDAARAWFEKARWPNGPECRRCGSVGDAIWMPNAKQWHCRSCSAHFSVTANTPMHRTHLPLLTWARAIWLLVSSSKGVSSMKLSQMLGLPYSTAWHLTHRIRAMMVDDSPLLRGIVEVDETYAGAPPRKRSKREDDDRGDPAGPTGRGTKRPLLLVAASRDGSVVAKRIATHGKKEIARALDGVLSPDATVVTDGLPAYTHLGVTHKHLTVTHSSDEYARTDAETGLRVHVNRVEAFNGLLQRAVVGVWHRISSKHLDRYATETAFRVTRRAQTCLERMVGLVRNGEGRVLPYRTLVEAG